MILQKDTLIIGLDADLSTLQQQLLTWFTTNARDLPWRRTRDPYRVLVSEMMLQQTQVDRVLPKYYAFLEAFPTLAALAEALTADVIRAWAGLGYNRRAVNMQRTAHAVLNEHGGVFPHDVAALLRLPGVGPYTAGAIACFAFEQDVAFMDTNIRRVIQRLFVGTDDAPAGEAALLALAQACIPAGQGWAWNQAVMELGALCCTAANPSCWRCPVQAHCRSYATRRAADEGVFDAQAGEQLPTRARRIAERREAPYAGSRRFYRGRIVDALRPLPHGAALPLAALGAQIKEGFGAEDLPWLRDLADSLARDGLLVVEGDGDAVRLP